MFGLPLYLYIAISITGIFALTPEQLIEILIMAAASETGISDAIKRGKRLVKDNVKGHKVGGGGRPGEAGGAMAQHGPAHA